MHDLIIIGGGPAGLTAGLYSARARLKVLLLERLAPGGQVLTTDRVENYPGFPEGISGFELVDRMKTQAERFGLDIRNEEVMRLELSGAVKIVTTPQEGLETKAVLLACGANWKRLGIEGEDLLVGKGVSYCATCDGPFYRDQDVAVIGGGDTAAEEAVFLTRFARRIYLLHRRDKLRATKLLQERLMAEEKISILWDTVPVRITGTNGVEGLEFKNVRTGEDLHLAVQGVFVFIGTVANTGLVKGLVELDENGFVVTDEHMETSVPGVFAAGDIRSKGFRQIATAVGEGAAASYSVERYLERREGRSQEGVRSAERGVRNEVRGTRIEDRRTTNHERRTTNHERREADRGTNRERVYGDRGLFAETSHFGLRSSASPFGVRGNRQVLLW